MFTAGVNRVGWGALGWVGINFAQGVRCVCLRGLVGWLVVVAEFFSLTYQFFSVCGMSYAFLDAYRRLVGTL